MPSYLRHIRDTVALHGTRDSPPLTTENIRSKPRQKMPRGGPVRVTFLYSPTPFPQLSNLHSTHSSCVRIPKSHHLTSPCRGRHRSVRLVPRTTALLACESSTPRPTTPATCSILSATTSRLSRMPLRQPCAVLSRWSQRLDTLFFVLWRVFLLSSVNGSQREWGLTRCFDGELLF